MDEGIEIIEEALLNSMPPLQTALLDGWVVRLNKNYTYRSNCACPVYYSESSGNTEKIHMCEELFEKNKLPPVIKVTPVLQKGLAGTLVSMGYQDIKKVNVMRCILKDTMDSSNFELQFSETPDNEWLAVSAELAGLISPDLISVHCQNLKSIAAQSIFVKAGYGGKIVGCGYGTVERGYVGIYDLHIDGKYRRRGIGTSILKKIMDYGKKNNAQYAYLIVNSSNGNAISLYSNLEFTNLYNYSFWQKPGSKYKITD